VGIIQNGKLVDIKCMSDFLVPWTCQSAAVLNWIAALFTSTWFSINPKGNATNIAGNLFSAANWSTALDTKRIIV